MPWARKRKARLDAVELAWLYETLKRFNGYRVRRSGPKVPPQDRRLISAGYLYRFAAGAACILLVACAGTVKEGMANLEGQPLSAVVARIGQPMGERNVGGRHLLLGHATAIVNRNAKSGQR
jgi:hypothetical protein